jgi:hypothetical protein
LRPHKFIKRNVVANGVAKKYEGKTQRKRACPRLFDLPISEGIKQYKNNYYYICDIKPSINRTGIKSLNNVSRNFSTLT